MKRHVETRARAKQLRADLTPPERRLWAMLRAGRAGVKFQKQVVLVGPYVADFAARAHRLVVELDGHSHAGRENHDAERTDAFEARGFRVLRFGNAEVMSNVEGVVRAFLVELGKDPETPRPL